MKPLGHVLAALLAAAITAWAWFDTPMLEIREAGPSDIAQVVGEQPLAWAVPGNHCTIVIFPALAANWPQLAQAVVIHEVGHCILMQYGFFGHFETRPSIMAVPVEGAGPSSYDREAIAAYWRAARIPHRLTVPLLAVDGCPCGMAYAQPVGPVTPLGE